MKTSEQRNDILEDSLSFYVYIKMTAALAHLSTYKDKLVFILCYVIYVALNYAYNSYEFWQTNKQTIQSCRSKCAIPPNSTLLLTSNKFDLRHNFLFAGI